MSSSPKGPRRPQDRYFTPPRLAREVVAALCAEGGLGKGSVAWEPHCGDGAFVYAMRERGVVVVASDISPGDVEGAGTLDFLSVGAPMTKREARPTWVIGNPPFQGALRHIVQALEHTGRHVVFLLRLGFMASKRRMAFWEAHPPRRVWVLSQRPSFTGGSTDSADYMVVWWDLEWAEPTTLAWLDWKKGSEE